MQLKMNAMAGSQEQLVFVFFGVNFAFSPFVFHKISYSLGTKLASANYKGRKWYFSYFFSARLVSGEIQGEGFLVLPKTSFFLPSRMKRVSGSIQATGFTFDCYEPSDGSKRFRILSPGGTELGSGVIDNCIKEERIKDIVTAPVHL